MSDEKMSNGDIHERRPACSVALAAGGTGGHIVPAIAVGEALLKVGAGVIYLGAGGEIERDLYSKTGCRHFEVPFSPISGKGLSGISRAALTILPSLLRCIRIYRKEGVDVVVGFGGYPAFVPIVSAIVVGIPTLVHEQNAVVGLCNRVLAPFVGKIIAPPGVRGFGKRREILRLSNPVRSAFDEIHPSCASGKSEGFNLLVVGGSQGARSLNEAIQGCIDVLRDYSVRVRHQSGRRDLERVRAEYRVADYGEVEVSPFIENMPEAYAWADVVLSRAGAMSVAETGASGRAAVFVPLSIAGGHQVENARYLVEAGGARMLEQGPELSFRLGNCLRELFSTPTAIDEMGKAAREASRFGSSGSAYRIAEEIISLSVVRRKRDG